MLISVNIQLTQDFRFDRMLTKVNIGGFMNIVHLSDLKKGQRAKVVSLHNDNAELKQRLLDMGIAKGVVIKVKKTAPFGDPVNIELRGYQLCLRKKDLSQIDIEVLE